MNICILSGGQTGSDTGALRAAKSAGIPTGGFAPRGFLTEDGPAQWLADYGLVELESAEYPDRTYANVKAADAIIWFGDASSLGGKLTMCITRELSRPAFKVAFSTQPFDLADWLLMHIFMVPHDGPLHVLVAGNRESSSPGIGARVEVFLSRVFRLLKDGG